MKKLLLTAMIALSPLPALADAPACQFTWTQLVEVSNELAATYPNLKATILTGSKAKSLLALITASPGGDAIDFDAIVFLENTNTHIVKFAYQQGRLGVQGGPDHLGPIQRSDPARSHQTHRDLPSRL
jgi:hypothetical protein